MYRTSKIATPDLRDFEFSDIRRDDRNRLQILDVRQQPIVDRQENIVGYETLAQFNLGLGSLEDVIKSCSVDALRQLTSDVLLGLLMRCRSTNAFMNGAVQTVVQHFVNVEKLSLTDPTTVDDIIEAAKVLRNSNTCLVVEITERPIGSGPQLKSYLQGLTRLKQADVVIALDDYNISSSVHWELDLGLCDIVKLDLPSLGITTHGDENSFEARYPALADHLFEFIHRYHVELLAEKVETDSQYRKIQGLPFKFFQGYHFGRPETIGWKHPKNSNRASLYRL